MSDPDTSPSNRSAAIRLLLVEDDPSDAQRVRELLEAVQAAEFEIAHATRLAHVPALRFVGVFAGILKRERDAHIEARAGGSARLRRDKPQSTLVVWRHVACPSLTG